MHVYCCQAYLLLGAVLSLRGSNFEKAQVEAAAQYLTIAADTRVGKHIVIQDLGWPQSLHLSWGFIAGASRLSGPTYCLYIPFCHFFWL